VAERGAFTCGVCGAPGRCRNCAAAAFGLERRGTERVAEWASHVSSLPVVLENEGEAPPAPGAETILVGTAAAVKDIGPARLDLVAILDPDRALARAGVRAGERALATWMEAAVWAGARDGGGRVLVQTRRPAHAAIQALVRWDPVPFLRAEAARRAEAGFPPNHPVFRIAGDDRLPGALRGTRPASMLTTAADGGTLCLVMVRPDDLPSFRRVVLRLAADGTVSRVEAEPQL
jgi:primosomal protein N' (replication factor Y)